MKQFSCLIILLFLIGISTSFGQPSVSEQEINMNLGIKNALVLDLPNSDSKLVEKLWRKYTKQFGGKTKKVKRSSEWMTDNATISSVSSDWLDLYASFENNGTDAQLNLWVNLGEDDFVNSYSHSTQYVELENILLHFAEEVRKENVNIEIDAEEKRLKKLEADFKRLVRDNENYHKEIENAKDRIKKAEANIITNEKEQENANELILKQQQILQAVREKLKGS